MHIFLKILAIPLMSLLLVAIFQVQMRSQRIAEEDIYERVGGGSSSAANVLAVRKVPSAIGGPLVANVLDDELSDPYEKSSPSTSSSSEGGTSESAASSGGKKRERTSRCEKTIA